MKHWVILNFVGLSFFINPLWADNLILDLDGVIVRTDSSACLRFMKLSNIIKTMIIQKQGPAEINKHIKNKLNEVLQKVGDLHSLAYEPERCAYDKHKQAYPPLMCAWLYGARSNEEIRLLAIIAIEQHPEWFSHPTEQEIIHNLINMIFTPEFFISTRKVYRNAVKFIRLQHKRGHKIYILSNWDAESFALLKAKHPEIFQFVHGVIISGEADALKPSPLIYQALLQQYNLDPQDSWFIDDQLENITAARDLEFNGILCEHTGCRKRPDFDLIQKHMGT